MVWDDGGEGGSLMVEWNKDAEFCVSAYTTFTKPPTSNPRRQMHIA